MKVERIELYNDGIGFVEKHDFSMANTSKEARIDTITKVASVCYDKEAKNKIALFNMLESESLGLPSSAFEFVPVLIHTNLFNDIYNYASENSIAITGYSNFTLAIEKYGSWVENINNDELDKEYLLTNLRACLDDEKLWNFDCINFAEFFNTDLEEIQIIKDNFKVFFEKIPLFVARQLVRHRDQNLQELSRRYTDNKTSPIEFYVKKDINKKENTWGLDNTIEHIASMCLDNYNFLIKKGMKPEDARVVLPTAMYTKIWSAFTPSGYDNFIKLRTKKKAQLEIRQLAEGFERLKND